MILTHAATDQVYTHQKSPSENSVLSLSQKGPGPRPENERENVFQYSKLSAWRLRKQKEH